MAKVVVAVMTFAFSSIFILLLCTLLTYCAMCILVYLFLTSLTLFTSVFLAKVFRMNFLRNNFSQVLLRLVRLSLYFSQNVFECVCPHRHLELYTTVYSARTKYVTVFKKHILVKVDILPYWLAGKVKSIFELSDWQLKQ